MIFYAIPYVILCALFVWRELQHAEAERAWRLERIGLLNRIENRPTDYGREAPEPSGEALHVPFEDDDAWLDFEKALRRGEVT